MIDVLDYLNKEEATQQTPVVKAAAVPTEDTEGVCFEIDRGVLKVLLEKAIEVVPNKDMIPVLKNFQFRVRGNKLSVVASNLNMNVISSTSMSVETKTGGVEVFPAKKLLEIVRESDAGSRIYINVTGRTCIVVAGSASWQISLGKGTDFPKMPKVAAEDLQTIDRDEFLRCLSTVKYAVGTSREALMMVDVKKGRFTACDGNRLQQARMSGMTGNMKIPAFAIDKLIKMLKGSDLEMMQIGEVHRHLVFKIGSDVLLVKGEETNFPPLEELWLRPALSNDQELKIEKTLLVDAIKRVKVAVDLEWNAISLRLEPGKPGFMGEMTISASDGDGNRAAETVPIQWSGAKRELVLHCRYLKEMLSSYPQDMCTFKLGEDQIKKKSPILLKDEEMNSMGIVQQMVGVPTDRRLGPRH